MSEIIDRNYKSICVILGVLFFTYFVSMFVYPWFKGGWENVHAVWYDWQALNVGLLAFGATLMLFNITRYRDEQQQQRELIANRAFMPEALSELNEYCKASAGLLKHLHQTFQAERNEDPQQLIRLRQFQLELPIQPDKYRIIFSKCISLAGHEMSEYLSYILNCMQVHDSRLIGMYEKYHGRSQTIYGSDNTLECMLRLCEIYILINNLFEYARGEQDNFAPKALTLDTFENSTLSLELLIPRLELLNIAERKLAVSQDDWRLGWPRRGFL